MSVDNGICYHRYILEELAVACWPDRVHGQEEPESRMKCSIPVLRVLRPARWRIMGKDTHGENHFQFFMDGVKFFESTNVACEHSEAHIRLDGLVDGYFPVEEIFHTLLATGAPAVRVIIVGRARKSQFRRLEYFALYQAVNFRRLFLEIKSPATFVNDPWSHF
ncbi:hypothetical protein PMIN07_002541 [Paraphaeosphaeria minitans]